MGEWTQESSYSGRINFQEVYKKNSNAHMVTEQSTVYLNSEEAIAPVILYFKKKKLLHILNTFMVVTSPNLKHPYLASAITAIYSTMKNQYFHQENDSQKKIFQ